MFHIWDWVRSFHCSCGGSCPGWQWHGRVCEGRGTYATQGYYTLICAHPIYIFITTTQVILSLKRALQPAVTEVSVVFQVPKEYEVVQCPASLPPIFNGEKLVSYAVLKTRKPPKKAVSCTAILKGNMLGKKQEHTIPFTIDGSVPAPSLPVIHHLAAKALITDLEIEGKEKKSIVDLSIESSVISSHTAFIAIDEESSEPVSGALKTYDVQTQMPTFGSVALGGALRSASKPKARGSKGGGGRSLLSRGVFKGNRRHKAVDMGMPQSFAQFQSAPPAPKSAPRYANLSMCAGSPPPAMASADNYYCAPDLLMCEGPPPPATALASTLEDLITAQKVDGSWVLTSSFAQLVGKSLSDLEAVCPIERKGAGATVWATVLAVSLLRARYSSQQEEWELIAMKAESWLKKQTLPSGYTLEQLFQAAQKQF